MVNILGNGRLEDFILGVPPDASFDDDSHSVSDRIVACVFLPDGEFVQVFLGQETSVVSCARHEPFDIPRGTRPGTPESDPGSSCLL